MVAAVLCLCLSAAAALRVPSVGVAPRPAALASRRAPVPLMQLPFIPPPGPSDRGDDDDDELDALEGCDSWEEQMAEQAMWEAEMAKKQSTPPKNTFGSGNEMSGNDNAAVPVDESAHLGLGDDDDETPAEIAARQIAEKKASEFYTRVTASAAVPETKRLMTSLEAVLNSMMRLETKVEKLTTKVDNLQAKLDKRPAAAESAAATPPADVTGNATTPATPATPAAPAVPDAPDVSGGWDGVEDESAYFDDDDDDDFADWRDVRRLKRMMEEQSEDKEDS